ncbi:putative MFS transporter [Rhodococcus percolatus]|uniref:MFS transporter n=1 Tax=Rhodococcus opacus TaxID=37919 RepID=UPI0015FDC352|nr:MFS transporter [Rhodococcus opacus]MBA8964567.1 putative MFS transporter [Rhodococcus opacus]MBP2207471.1 putative MFS transporter [Rhodococcus opacus]
MASTADSATSRVAEPSLAARMSRLPSATPTQRRWLVLLGALMLFDQADLNAFAYAAPAVRAQWDLSVGDIGILTSASFFGMFVGSTAGGWLADRYGRKWTIIGATFWYSAFSLACAFAVGMVDLTIYRVLTGAGLQAMVAVLLAYVAEMFPRHLRGRIQALTLAVGLAGIPLMAWFSRFVIPTGPSAWRWIFVLGAGGVVIGIVSIWKLPESVRWQEANGRGASAAPIVEKLEREALSLFGALPEPEEEGPIVKARTSELFGRAYIRRTLVAAVMLTFLAVGFYGFNSWLPTLLVDHGLSASQSLTYTSILSLAAVPGALFAWLFIDRWERRRMLWIIESIVAVLMLVFGFTNSAVVLLASGLLITLLLQTGTAFVFTYLPEIFPTRLRGTGTGFVNGIGRIAGFGSGFLIAGVYAGLGYAAVFIVTAGAMALMGMTVGVFGERTTNRSLEQIATTTDPTEDVQARKAAGRTDEAVSPA